MIIPKLPLAVVVALLPATALAAQPNMCVKTYGERARAIEVSSDGYTSYFVCNVGFPESKEMYDEFVRVKERAGEAAWQSNPNDTKLISKLLARAKRKCPKGTSPGVHRGVGAPEGSVACWRRMTKQDLCLGAGVNVYDPTLPCIGEPPRPPPDLELDDEPSPRSVPKKSRPTSR